MGQPNWFGLCKGMHASKKFEKIRSIFHLNNNENFIADQTDPCYDKLYKIRPLVDCLNVKFSSIPFEERLSVDEQMCASKASHHLKQYMPAKPHKWGYKLFVLSGASGFAYNFEIYTGQNNLPHKRLPSEPDLGASVNVVVRLLRSVPNGCNYKVYFDNYYTAIPLLVYLGKKGIHTVGTVRRNRIQNCKLPTDQEIKKFPRGSSFQFVADFEGLELANVLWKDNKNVTLLSSFVGVEPENDVSRFDRRESKSIMVKCPAIVKEYNRHMGGVDLLDRMMGRNRIKMKTRKWYMRLVYHLLDLAVTNAWYKRATGNTTLTLLKFRKDLALTLLKINTKQKRQRTNDSPSVER